MKLSPNCILGFRRRNHRRRCNRVSDGKKQREKDQGFLRPLQLCFWIYQNHRATTATSNSGGDFFFRPPSLRLPSPPPLIAYQEFTEKPAQLR
uniref:Uncharacterized protein n=1 Tax=Nelumbo nucifera TaxID=4432 RepID=A0A822Z8Y6_NELNU|nr:TPA_asm: hypothetical protein HUJ06_015835 [Nelumbo nucifera]